MVSTIESKFPFSSHPCWSTKRGDIWERIHLPVARRCNVKCAYCNNGEHQGCRPQRPGMASRIMSVQEALERALNELERRPRLGIVAVSGPGEPLANPETFSLLDGIRRECPKIEFCLSTNGVLLGEETERLVSLGMKAISVTVNTLNPAVAAQVYEWAIVDDNVVSGISMAHKLTARQSFGISSAVDAGIAVKANTILIPGVNDHEILNTAESLADLGVSLQNIVPLIPCARFENSKSPSAKQLRNARLAASAHIRQFVHCRQCRSDVVGIPGNDVIL
ncbi:MAG: radical SAM protein [Candidatus Thorarchaeota archaeon]|nr:MAG: radical SAM protein [Candidatus Thorarchaeota archaeon]